MLVWKGVITAVVVVVAVVVVAVGVVVDAVVVVVDVVVTVGDVVPSTPINKVKILSNHIKESNRYIHTEGS